MIDRDSKGKGKSKGKGYEGTVSVAVAAHWHILFMCARAASSRSQEQDISRIAGHCLIAAAFAASFNEMHRFSAVPAPGELLIVFHFVCQKVVGVAFST